MSSRSLDDLAPVVKTKAERFLNLCKDADIDVLVTCTYRSIDEQNDLYAQGRTKPGAIVTNARGGQSWHNWRCAIDVVPMRFGKPVWGTFGIDGQLWREVARLGKLAGLTWGGDFVSFKDFPHFQYTDNLTFSQAAAGQKPT